LGLKQLHNPEQLPSQKESVLGVVVEVAPQLLQYALWNGSRTSHAQVPEQERPYPVPLCHAQQTIPIYTFSEQRSYLINFPGIPARSGASKD
jgi:hypothetical protein